MYLTIQKERKKSIVQLTIQDRNYVKEQRGFLGSLLHSSLHRKKSRQKNIHHRRAIEVSKPQIHWAGEVKQLKNGDTKRTTQDQLIQ